LASAYGVKRDDNEQTSSVRATVREVQGVEPTDSPDSNGSSHTTPRETGQNVLDTLTREKQKCMQHMQRVTEYNVTI